MLALVESEGRMEWIWLKAILTRSKDFQDVVSACFLLNKLQ